MGAVVERDESWSGKDPEHPIALSVQIGEKDACRYQGMSFEFMYRLRIEGDNFSKSVVGVCDMVDMRSPPLDDTDVAEYITRGFELSIPVVRQYLQERFPAATITGRIRIRSESTYQPELEL